MARLFLRKQKPGKEFSKVLTSITGRFLQKANTQKWQFHILHGNNNNKLLTNSLPYSSGVWLLTNWISVRLNVVWIVLLPSISIFQLFMYYFFKLPKKPYIDVCKAPKYTFISQYKEDLYLQYPRNLYYTKSCFIVFLKNTATIEPSIIWKI